MQAPAVDPKPQRSRRHAQRFVRAKRGERLRFVRAKRGERLRLVALIAALTCGCNLDNRGDDPPAQQLYFTNAIALSVPAAQGEAPRYLFAANSNYDLRYNAGTVVAIDLDAVTRRIEAHRGVPNYIIEPSEVMVDEVFIGAYSSAHEMAPDGDTLFVATRTDDNLAFVDVDAEAEGDDVLTCRGDSGRNCKQRAVPIADPMTGEALVWPEDPTSILARPLQDFTDDPAHAEELAVLVSHRDGFVSLFTSNDDGGFDFVDVLGSFGGGLTGLDFEPTSRLAYGSFGGRAFARIGVAVADGTPAVLYGADPVPLDATSVVIAGRDIEFVAKTGTGLAAAQNNMLVVGQNPNALSLVALGDQPRNGEPQRSLQVLRSTVVGFGAFRVATGMLGGKPIALVSCLDSREIYVIDLDTMLPRSVVPQLSGPFDIQYDEVRQLLYVADYSSSVIRVVDLTPVAESNGRVPALLVATIGEPRVIQELR
jgi:hypothetical protein